MLELGIINQQLSLRQARVCSGVMHLSAVASKTFYLFHIFFAAVSILGTEVLENYFSFKEQMMPWKVDKTDLCIYELLTPLAQTENMGTSTSLD